MLDNCFGIISVKNDTEDFGALCKPRGAYMLPYGGRYRIVDFMLSNMVNHGIDTVAVYTGSKFRSAMDHIGDGQPWELNRRISGLHIFPPQHMDGFRGSGDIAQYYLTDDFIKEVKEENVYIIGSNKVAKIDLSTAYQEFLESDADISLIYSKVKNDSKHLESESLILDDNGKFVNLGVNLGASEYFNLFLGSVFIKKSVMRQLIRENMETGEKNFLKDAFINSHDDLKVTTFEHKYYFEDIKDAKSYYSASINLLDEEVSKETFADGGQVYTRTKDEPPTLYSDDSRVKNSIIANGCIIEGNVENSIVFRGVKIKKGAVIKDSIIMQKSTIDEDAYIVKSILDKHVIVDKGVTIVGTKSNPYIVEKGTRIRKAD